MQVSLPERGCDSEATITIAENATDTHELLSDSKESEILIWFRALPCITPINVMLQVDVVLSPTYPLDADQNVMMGL